MKEAMQEACLNLCHHFYTLLNIHITVIQVDEGEFILPTFQLACKTEGGGCNAKELHLRALKEARRWGGQYTYYGKCGLAFIAISVLNRDTRQYGLIAGPIRMGNGENEIESYPFDRLSENNIPAFTATQVRSLGDVLYFSFHSIISGQSGEELSPSERNSIMNLMYDLHNEGDENFPIELERQLRNSMRVGDRDNTEHLLAELMNYICASAGATVDSVREYIHDLMILMSRAAIDGGADAHEVVKFCNECHNRLKDFTTIEEQYLWVAGVLKRFMNFTYNMEDGKHSNIMSRAAEYIRSNLTKQLTLEDVAKQVFVSKEYFSRLIKRETGFTYTQYVNRLRVERAAIYIKESNMSMADIAHAVGFSDQSYFTKIFTKLIGVAPLRYRDM